MGQRGTFTVTFDANGNPMRAEVRKSEADLKRWEGSVARMQRSIEGSEKKAARSFAVIAAALKNMSAQAPLSESQIARVRAEIERLEKTGARAPQALRDLLPKPEVVSAAVAAQRAWRAEVDAGTAALKGIAAEEAAAGQALQQLSQVVREMGGVSALSVRQLAYVRQEIERLRAAGAKVVPLRLQPVVQGPAPVSRAVTDNAKWTADVGRLRSELRNLGRDETRALAALGRVVDEMGGLGASSRLTADQVAHVRKEVERLTAAGGKAPKSLASLVPTGPPSFGILGQLRAGATGEIENVAQSYAGNLGGVGAAIARVHPAALALTAVLGGTAAALGAGLNILRQWSGELLDTAGNIQDVSVQTGRSTTTLQEWQAAGRLSGVSLDSIAEASGKLSRSIETGGAGVARALSDLGLSLDELRGMNPDQQFEAVADAMARIEAPGKQAALTMQLFKDKSGGLLKVLRDDFHRAADDAHRFGLVLSEDTIKKADQLGDAITTLKGAWAGLKAEVAATVVTSPAAKGGIEELTELVARYALKVREAKQADLGALGNIAQTPLLGNIAGVLRGAATYADAQLPDLGPLAPQRGRAGGMATATAEQFFASGTATATGRAGAFDAMARAGLDQEETLTRESDALFALQDEVAALGAAHRSTYAGMVADVERSIAARRREALAADNSGAQLAQIERIRALQLAETRRSFTRSTLGEDAGDPARAMHDLAVAADLARQHGALTTDQFERLGAALDAAARKGEQIPAALQPDLDRWRTTGGPWGETSTAAPQIQAQFAAFQQTLQAREAAGTMTPGAWEAAGKEIDALAMRARAARVEVDGLREAAGAVDKRFDQERIGDEVAKAKKQLDRELARGPQDVNVQAAAWSHYADTLSRLRLEARSSGIAVAHLGQQARQAGDQAGAAKLSQAFNNLDEELAALEARGASSAAFDGLLGQFQALAEEARAAGLYVGNLQERIARLTLRRDVTALSNLRAQPLQQQRDVVDRYLNLDAAFNPESGGVAPQNQAEWTFYAHALQEVDDDLARIGVRVPNLKAQLADAFRHASSSTLQWASALQQVGAALGSVGGQTAGLAGTVVSSIGAGIENFQQRGKLSIAEKVAAAGSTAIDIYSSSKANRNVASRTLGGAAKGAAAGAMFGPIGMAAGAIGGALIGALSGPAWAGAAKTAARVLGDAVSDQLAQAIYATSEKLGINASMASLLHISDAIQETGSDPRKYGSQIIDLFNAVKLGVIPAREGVTELGKAFTAVANEAEHAGTAGDATLRSLIARARELRIDVPEIREFMSRQTDALVGSMGFIASSSTSTRGLYDAQGNPRYRTDRQGNRIPVLDAEGAAAVDKLGNPLYEQATERVVKQTGGIQISTQEDATAQGTIFGVAWAVAVRQRGFVGAADALREAFGNLTNTASELGYDIGAALGDIPLLMKLTEEDNPFRGAATGAQQLSGALKAVANEDVPLTTMQFGAFEQQAQRSFDQARQAALDAGYDAAQAQAVALEAVAPLLSTLLEVSRSYGISLSDGTQGLLDMASASGVAFKTDAADKLIEAINALTRALGGIPPAAERAGSALGRIGASGDSKYGDRGFGDEGSPTGAPLVPGVPGPRPPRAGFFNPDYTAAAGFGPTRLTRDTVIQAHRGEHVVITPASLGAMAFVSASTGLYGSVDPLGSDTVNPYAVPFLPALGPLPNVDYRAFSPDRLLSPLGGLEAPNLLAGQGGAGEGLADLVQAALAQPNVTLEVASPTTHINHGFMTTQDQREYMRTFEKDLARSVSRGVGPMAEGILEYLRRRGVKIGASA